MFGRPGQVDHLPVGKFQVVAIGRVVEIPGPGARAVPASHRGPHALGQGPDQRAEVAAVRRKGIDVFDAIADFSGIVAGGCHTAESKQSRDPSGQELKCAFPRREAERAQAEGISRSAVVGGQFQVAPAEEAGERAIAAAQVEDQDARAVLQRLNEQEIQREALARPGRPEDQGVPETIAARPIRESSPCMAAFRSRPAWAGTHYHDDARDDAPACPHHPDRSGRGDGPRDRCFRHHGSGDSCSRAAILIVWTGLRIAFTGDFRPWDIVRVVIALWFPWAMLTFYHDPLPGSTRSFTEAITGGGQWLQLILIQNTGEDFLVTFSQLSQNLFARAQSMELGTGGGIMDMLINGLTDLSYLLMSFIHTIIFELFLLFILLCLVVIYGVSMAQVLGAQLALGVLLILGPLFIPFLLVEPLAFLFWGWFESMFTYTLYGAIAAALMRVFLAASIGWMNAIVNGPPPDTNML